MLGPLVLAMALPACGGGSRGGSAADQGSSQASVAPEEHRASAAEVTAGLKRLDGLAQQVAGLVGTDQAKAVEVHKQIEPQWEQVEGTIKANDQNAYLSFEDSLAVLGSAVRGGDAAGAAKGAADVSAAVARYLTAYPG
jgi:hypothetical protein